MKLLLFFGLLAAATAEDTSLSSVNDEFTAKLFNAVLENNQDKSVIFSAFSVMPPLVQLSWAAEGDSHDELLKAFGLPNDNVTQEVFRGFDAKLRATKGVEIKLANRIYVANDAEINPSFSELTRSIFESDLKNLNFKDNIKAAQEMNTWVEEQTNHKIKDLVDPNSLSGLTRAVLVNAIYFKGSWKEKFDKERTKDGDFHISKDQTVKVPMMHKTATFLYTESSELDAKLLELPYEGEESSLLIVLPNEIDGLKNLEVKMKDTAVLRKATLEMRNTEVIVKLPKFKIETKTDLKETLTKIGIKNIFDAGKANLNKLLKNESNIYISEATQKAFIEVNEDGAEAAAANVFIPIGFAPSILQTIELHVNRPFFFEIRRSDLSLFQGTVYKP